MCFMAIAAVASVAQGVVGAMSAKSTADANAAALENQARMRLEKGKFDSEQALNRYNRQAGEVRANVGASGLDIGSFGDVLADAAIEGALERETIKWQAEAEAANLRFQADAAKQQGSMEAFGALLGGVGGAIGSMSGSVNTSTPSVSMSSPWQTMTFFS